MEIESAFDLLSRPDTNAMSFAELASDLKSFDSRTLTRIEVEGGSNRLQRTFPTLICTSSEGQYNAQLHRQAHDIRVFMQDESITISPEVDFSVIPGLSYELKERLREVRPMTIVSYYDCVHNDPHADSEKCRELLRGWKV